MNEVITSPEIQKDSLRQINEYLKVLQGIDPTEYKNASGILDDVLDEQTDTFRSSEIHTRRALNSLGSLATEPTNEALKRSLGYRTAAARQVVRLTILGSRIPEEDFGYVIGSVGATINTINGKEEDDEYAKEKLREEILDVWSFSSTVASQKRTAEAFKFVDKPNFRRYGKMMVKVAQTELS